MDLIKTKKDQITAFNFNYIKGTYLKTFTSKTTYKTELLNYTLVNFFIEINHTKKTISVNGKKYNLLIDREFVYKIRKKSKTIFCMSSENLERHFMDSIDFNSDFHHMNFSLLSNILK